MDNINKCSYCNRVYEKTCLSSENKKICVYCQFKLFPNSKFDGYTYDEYYNMYPIKKKQ